VASVFGEADRGRLSDALVRDRFRVRLRLPDERLQPLLRSAAEALSKPEIRSAAVIFGPLVIDAGVEAGMMDLKAVISK
jgi:hypothetical protein